MKAKLIAAAAIGLPLLAAIDGNITHWSTPLTGGRPAEAAAAPQTGGWSTPLPADTIDLADLDNPHHDFPALDIPVATGTPITAIRGGTVSYVGGDCGLGISVTDAAGVRWKYCHSSARLVDEGATVTAGQVIARSGSTGNSSGPHLHLEILAGSLRCPGPLLAALYVGRSVDPFALPTSGCVGSTA